MIWIVLAFFAIWLVMRCVIETSKEIQSAAGISPQPLITDQEFCELMPHVSKDVAMKVRGIMADVSGWEREEIHPDTKIIEFESW